MAGLDVSCTAQEWRESVVEDIPEVVLVPLHKTCVPTPPQLLTSAIGAHTRDDINDIIFSICVS